jgi:hypothetical protein
MTLSLVILLPARMGSIFDIFSLAGLLDGIDRTNQIEQTAVYYIKIGNHDRTIFHSGIAC